LVLLGLRVARAAHSASNGSAINGLMRWLDESGGSGSGGSGGLDLVEDGEGDGDSDEDDDDDAAARLWNGLRGGITGSDWCEWLLCTGSDVDPSDGDRD